MRCLAVLPVAVVTLIAAMGCGPSLRRMHRSEVYFERCYAADFDPAVAIAQRRACWLAWMEHWQADQPPDRVDYVRERVLRLDPERAAIVALATGADDSPDAAPEIAAEATVMTEAMGRDATGGESAPSDVTAGDADAGVVASTDAGAEIVAGAGDPNAEPSDTIASRPTVTVAADHDPEAAVAVGEPETAPRTIPSARERRLRRAPLMPAVDRPHCAEACRPDWAVCTGRCDTGDRFACIRACRLELRACSRACY
jgi:hypothetical protein